MAHTHWSATKVTDPSAQLETTPSPKMQLPHPRTVTGPTTAPKNQSHQRCCRSSCRRSSSSSSCWWWQFLCGSRPHGQEAGRQLLWQGSVRGLACSAAAAPVVVHKMATGPCALTLTLYVYLMPTPPKYRPTKHFFYSNVFIDRTNCI